MNQKDFDQIVDELVYHHVSRSGTKTTELNQELSLGDETVMVGGENDIDLSILDLDQNRSSLPLRKVKKSDLNKDQLLIKTMKIDKVNVKVTLLSLPVSSIPLLIPLLPYPGNGLLMVSISGRIR